MNETQILTELGYDEASCKLIAQLLSSCHHTLITIDSIHYIKNTITNTVCEINKDIILNYQHGVTIDNKYICNLKYTLQKLLHIQNYGGIKYKNGLVLFDSNYERDLLMAYLYHKT
jgi:hypothetical protein